MMLLLFFISVLGLVVIEQAIECSNSHHRTDIILALRGD